MAKVAEMTMVEGSPLMMWSSLNKQEKRRQHHLAAVVVLVWLPALLEHTRNFPLDKEHTNANF
jgi:hypothetical protein